MARLATDLGNARPERQALYYHRFRGGDARNSTRAFLRGLLAALADWGLLPAAPATAEDHGDQIEDLLEAVRARLGAVAALAPPRTQAPAPRFLVLADGLDEVLPQDPRLPQRLRELALPGTLWLLASRPEPALDRAFSGPGCAHLFPQGLPPLSAPDLRAMLLEGLASARQSLVARDEDSPQGVHNPFVERVVACAAGLPLYVHLLLEDLRGGRLTVHDEDRLPKGLVAYYDALMAGIGLSDLKRDLPLLIACLARAEEPLDPAALALLLADVPADAPDYSERARQAVRAGRVLLRDAPTANGTLGLTLYHQSFRDYVGGVPADGGRPAIPPAPDLAGTVRDAERKLCRLADGWVGLPPGHLRQHLFRWGVRYALRWQGAAGLKAARQRLTDFAFLQAYTAELTGSAIRGLVADYETVLARLPEGSERQTFRLWEAFFREREHILRRGDERWPVHKILLQLAVEHADDSPVTRAAEDWLAAGHCDWVWLRNPQRVARAVPDPCLRVLEGHTRSVNGAMELSGGRILSWSDDNTLRLWNRHSGAPLATCVGHTDSVKGALELPTGSILSWSWGPLRLWDGDTGKPLGTLRHTHISWIIDAQEVSGGRILSCAVKKLCLWDGQSGALLTTLEGHTQMVRGARELSDGRLLSWSWDHSLRLWDGLSGAPLAILEGHTDKVDGALELSDGRLLSWSRDQLRLWDGRKGTPLATLEKNSDSRGVNGALELADGRILTWSSDQTLQIWDVQSGTPLVTLEGHNRWFTRGNCALELSDGRLLSLSGDQLRLWDGKSGAPLSNLEGHTDLINGVVELSDGRILSWSRDQTLRLWNGQNGAPLAILEGHTSEVEGARQLSDGRILSWSHDKTLRLWDEQSDTPPDILESHKSYVNCVRLLADGRILSWSRDQTLRLWNGQNGAPLAILEGHTSEVEGARQLSDGRILSWSHDKTLRLWDEQSGAPLATFEGHTDSGSVSGVSGVLELSNGCILSWSETKGDSKLYLWDGRNGAPLTILDRHTDHLVQVVRFAADTGILSWSKRDKTLRLWDERSGAGHANRETTFTRRAQALKLSDGRILSWFSNNYLGLWDGQTCGLIAILEGHTDRVMGALELSDGRLLSWSSDLTLRLWDGLSGAPLATLEGHTGPVENVLELSDGHLLSWSQRGVDRTLRLWEGQTGVPLATLDGHKRSVIDVLQLSDGRLLSWSWDHSLRLWDGLSGAPIAILEGHTDKVDGALELSDGRLLSWSVNEALSWGGHSGQPIHGPIRRSDLPWETPELLHRLHVDSPQKISGQSVGWAYGNRAGIVSRIAWAGPACWHGNSAIESHALLPQGILVISLASGHVFCLQLYRGAQRITLEDYESGSSPLVDGPIQR